MLRAVQVVVDEGLARPILVGRPAVIRSASSASACACSPGTDFDMINPERDDRYREYWTEYYRLTQRKGVSQAYAQDRDAPPADADRRDGDPSRRGRRHAVRHVRHARAAPALHRPGDRPAPRRADLRRDERGDAAGPHVFIADTYVNPDPTAEQLAEITLLAAEEIRRFGIDPKVALLSHSSFGSSTHPSGDEDAARARARQRDGPRPRGRRRDARRRRARRGSAARACSRTRG